MPGPTLSRDLSINQLKSNSMLTLTCLFHIPSAWTHSLKGFINQSVEIKLDVDTYLCVSHPQCLQMEFISLDMNTMNRRKIFCFILVCVSFVLVFVAKKLSLDILFEIHFKVSWTFSLRFTLWRVGHSLWDPLEGKLDILFEIHFMASWTFSLRST